MLQQWQGAAIKAGGAGEGGTDARPEAGGRRVWQAVRLPQLQVACADVARLQGGREGGLQGGNDVCGSGGEKEGGRGLTAICRVVFD